MWGFLLVPIGDSILLLYLATWMIPFHIPFKALKEKEYLEATVNSDQKSGNGEFYRKCQERVNFDFKFQKTIFTNSCTDALELAAILLDIKPGDEVILPSYTFVSTANAFLLRGAKLVFCDSELGNPNLDANHLEQRISNKTKAVVVVHYGGRTCNMGLIMELSQRFGFYVIEDAAQCIGALKTIPNEEICTNSKFLGTQGHLSTFSFHDTKNIHCGEGGLLVVNDNQFAERAEIIKDKGTNRASFYRGEVDKYTWVDVGSSFLPSEYNMAVLLAQLEQWQEVTTRRQQIWHTYHRSFSQFMDLFPPKNPGNAHNYYLVFYNEIIRNEFIQQLKNGGIQTSFHYQPLHLSPMAVFLEGGLVKLPNAEKFGAGLVRLPLYPQLDDQQVDYIVEQTLKCLESIKFKEESAGFHRINLTA